MRLPGKIQPYADAGSIVHHQNYHYLSFDISKHYFGNIISISAYIGSVLIYLVQQLKQSPQLVPATPSAL